MDFNGESIGVIGALKAFPLRVAARLVADHGGHMHRGTPRGTTMAVICSSILTGPAEQVLAKVGAAKQATDVLRSENGLMRLLGRQGTQAHANVSRQALVDQSGLDYDVLDILALFDAFEHDLEPFSFRDLILARKYAGLIATGADWHDIARALHPAGPASSLTALSLELRGERILAQDRFSFAELDGQRLLPFPEPLDESEDYFSHAEAAEAAGLFAEAATLYGHCAALDRSDATAPFNEGNCLREAGEAEGALVAYAASLKRDPSLVEAWFNSANILRGLGRTRAARTHLETAVKLDASYADAIYNLAALAYEQGDLNAAASHWRRYLELDDQSEWAQKARAGLALINQTSRRA